MSVRDGPVGTAGLAVPLGQLEAVHADPRARQGIEGWHSWVRREGEL